MAKEFNPTADLSIYDDGGAAATKLMKEVADGRLEQQHHWFSLFNTRQREEALMLFDVLFHCKNWDCAVHNAAYFREKMNEGEFVYALYVTVIHAQSGTGIVLPPLYEVTPHMFTNSEVIQKAYSAQMTQHPGKFKMDFTGTRKNPEQHVAYFGEDIGMNVHHVTWHMDFPFWWDDAYGFHLDRKGELFFWAHHQLTARFDSERLSNHLDMVEELYWDQPIKEGFAPHTTYRYGGEFPTRPDNINFADVEGVIRVRDMIIHESRIRDAIAHGYITAADGSHIDIMNNEGIDHLGDIIESSLYSPNMQYYGALHNQAHILLGRQSDPKGKFNLPPSVMEHFETATRDPAFFRLHKYMDGIFKEHKDSLPSYTAEEVGFPGVHLNDVHIEGELQTYFEDYEFDLKMAVDTSEAVKQVAVSASVPRLNHKNFAYSFDVTNDNAADAHSVVRVFLCPRRDNNGIIFSFEEGRWHCIEMDKFWHKCEYGEHFETATRDPAFFRLHKYMDGIFKEHKDSLPSYTAEEVGFPGVHLNDVHIEGELQTYFEDYEFDLKMAVDTSEAVKQVAVSASVPRLNHKNFAYSFDVTNDNAADAHSVVRVFLCPRRDNNGIIFSFEEGRWHCIEMDKFWHKCEYGHNLLYFLYVTCCNFFIFLWKSLKCWNFFFQ